MTDHRIGTRSVRLEFFIDTSEELSPSEFRDLFTIADSMVRQVAERESLRFLETIGVRSEERLSIIQRRRALGRRVPTPADVVSIRRGSWSVELLIAGQVILYVLKNYVDPVIREAWNGSRLRHAIQIFLRERIFLGTQRDIEEIAAESPTAGNLRVKEIETSRAWTPDTPAFRVSLERREILEGGLEEHELIDQFINRLLGVRR